MVLEPSCPACGLRQSPLAVPDLTDTYLAVLTMLMPAIFDTMEPRVFEAAAKNWHDAMRMLMRPLRARQVWPMFSNPTTTEHVTNFLSMVGSEGHFTRTPPVSHIDALRHYSFEWALWRNRLGSAKAGKRIALPCATCGALGQCAPACTAGAALCNGFRRAAASAKSEGPDPVLVDIRVVAPGERARGCCPDPSLLLWQRVSSLPLQPRCPGRRAPRPPLTSPRQRARSATRASSSACAALQSSPLPSGRSCQSPLSATRMAAATSATLPARAALLQRAGRRVPPWLPVRVARQARSGTARKLPEGRLAGEAQGCLRRQQ